LALIKEQLKTAPKRLLVDPPMPPVVKKETYEDYYGEELGMEDEADNKTDHEEEGDMKFIDDMEQEDNGETQAKRDAEEMEEKSEKKHRLQKMRNEGEKMEEEEGKSPEKKKEQDLKVEYDENDNSFDDL
jgi:hypothetical protein